MRLMGYNNQIAWETPSAHVWQDFVCWLFGHRPKYVGLTSFVNKQKRLDATIHFYCRRCGVKGTI